MESTRNATSAAVLITAVAELLIARPAPAQELLWVKQVGTANEEQIHGLAADDTGGAFVAGWTDGPLGGPRLGGTDAFIGRFDSAGNEIWMKQLGTLSNDYAFGASSDGVGGVFVVGKTTGELGGPAIGFDDGFLARYDAESSRLWIKQFGTSNTDWPWAVAMDGMGGALVAGATGGDLGGQNAGGGDAFVARFDEAGNILWSGQLGTTRREDGYAVALDGTGGAYVAGRTKGALGGPNAGEDDVFLARFDNEGNQLWIRQFGTNEFDFANGLASDGTGGVFVTGKYASALNGTGSDIFLARYDSAGNELWFRQFGTPSFDMGYAVTPDGVGGAIIAGVSAGSFGARHLGFGDVVLVRCDGNGNQLWVRQFGTTFVESPRAVARDANGGIFVAGLTMTSFGGPYAGGATDAFIARHTDSCYADCDPSTGVGVLDIFDFLCFQNSFVSGEPYACDCDPDPLCDIFDFLCFQNAFVAGCP